MACGFGGDASRGSRSTCALASAVNMSFMGVYAFGAHLGDFIEEAAKGLPNLGHLYRRGTVCEPSTL
jgi:hypothetical protein